MKHFLKTTVQWWRAVAKMHIHIHKSQVVVDEISPRSELSELICPLCIYEICASNSLTSILEACKVQLKTPLL